MIAGRHVWLVPRLRLDGVQDHNLFPLCEALEMIAYLSRNSDSERHIKTII
jgi:hypothetical protein